MFAFLEQPIYSLLRSFSLNKTKTATIPTAIAAIINSTGAKLVANPDVAMGAGAGEAETVIV